MNNNLRQTIIEAGGDDDLREEIGRLWTFLERQSYFDEKQATMMLGLYAVARVQAAKAIPDSDEMKSSMGLASRLLDSLGLTPESRTRAIANRRQREALGK